MTELFPAPRDYGVTPLPTMMSMAGIDFLRAMFSGELPAPPMMELMGLDGAGVEPGVVVMMSTPTLRHYNPIGVVHGGYTATMLDSVMALAVQSMLPAGRGFTSLEFKVSFIRPITAETGQLRSEGRTLNVGRQAATSEGRVLDSKGRLLAHGTTTCLVFEAANQKERPSQTVYSTA